MKTMRQSECIVRIGRFVYARLLDQKNYQSFFFKDEEGAYDCTQIFWRFYWVTSITDF